MAENPLVSQIDDVANQDYLRKLAISLISSLGVDGAIHVCQANSWDGVLTGAELLFEVFSQRYERGSTLVTSNLPFDEWTEVFGSGRLTGALLDRLTHHVHILEMNGDSYRLNQSRRKRKSPQRT